MDFIEENDRIFLKDESGTIIAKVDFPAVGQDGVNITHTFVDPSLRGQGVADKLMQAAADKFRREDKKAVASCSYAIRWLGEHPEYRDILVD